MKEFDQEQREYAAQSSWEREEFRPSRTLNAAQKESENWYDKPRPGGFFKLSA